MKNQILVRGLFLMAIALLFGVWSTNYQIGQFSRAGPALFPLMVSCVLFLIGLITAVRSYFLDHVPIEFNLKNISIVLASLCGFALLSEYVNMTVGIVFMVFLSTWAGTSYSLVRNVKISAGLVAIALAMQHLLGVNLPLY